MHESPDRDRARARAVGINHVALEVGDIDGALEFYGAFLQFRLRSRSETMAFIDLGDQFIALALGERHADEHRHFGLVVDDLELVRKRLADMGVALSGSDFRDPWGNRVQLVQYSQVQYSKLQAALRALGVSPVKDPEPLRELEEKGIDPSQAGVRRQDGDRS